MILIGRGLDLKASGEAEEQGSLRNGEDREAEGTEEQQERSVLNCEREAKRARAKRTEGEAQAEPEGSGATGSEAACESCAVLKVREKRRRGER